MADSLAKQTASIMYEAAKTLQTTLVHNGLPFNHSHLVTAASLIGSEKVDVRVNEAACHFFDADAFYASREQEFIDRVTREVIGYLPGNTLYVKAAPLHDTFWMYTLAHEAVHLISDVRGVPEGTWDNEGLGYFVGAFVAVRRDESLIKRTVKANDYKLIGCLASDWYNAVPYAGAISSAKFDDWVTFDYSALGGRTGRANPYKVLTNYVEKHYRNGKMNGKKTDIPFDGIQKFEPSKLPATVYEAYKLGAMAWPLVLDKAIGSGIRDVDKLTDIVFFLHHPERDGRSLAPDEKAQINQWKSFRSLVQPRAAAEGSPVLQQSIMNGTPRYE